MHVPGKPDAASILQAIAAGHVSLSDDPDGPFLDLRAGKEGEAMPGDLLGMPPWREAAASGALLARQREAA